MTAPAPFNNFLWWALIETDRTFLVGYYSFFDRDKSIEFQRIPKTHEKLDPVKDHADVRALKRFTKGYYAIENDENGLIFNDLRFGIVSGWFDLSKDYLFSFSVSDVEERVEVRRRERSQGPSKEDFDRLIDRAKGI